MSTKELILYVDESGIHKSAEHSSFAFVYVRVDDIDEPIIRLADALANVVRIYHDHPPPVIVELFRLVMKKHRS